MDNVRDLFANTGNAHLGYSLRNAASEYFVIDGEARTITPPATFKHFGVESDENSNRIWFEAPQIVGDNIDLATLNLRVNFKNANGDKDIYIVEDVEADGLNIRFSWLLSRKVTLYKGNVSFIVCAVKTGSGGKVQNEWNTTLCTGSVLEGLEATSPEVEESTSDLISQLVDMINGATNEVNNAKAEALSDIEDAKTEAIIAIGKADTTPFSNSLKATASGEVVRVDDVSPLEHTAKAKVRGKNLADIHKAAKISEMEMSIEDDSIIISARDNVYGFRFEQKNMGFVVGKTYTASIDTISDYAEQSWGWRVLYADKTYEDVQGSRNKIYTFTPNREVNALQFYIGSPYTGNREVTVTGIQIEEGNTATEYEPYIDPATVTVTKCGKNVFKNTAKTQTSNGITCTINEDGSATFNGTVEKTTFFALGKIQLTVGATYHLSGSPSGSGFDTYILYIHNNTSGADIYDAGNGKTFTGKEGDQGLTIAMYEGTVVNNLKFCPMVVVGEESGDYEPYNSETYTPNADGTVDIVSVSPTMTLLTDTAGVTIDLEYNQDTNVALDNVKKDIAELDRMIVEMLGIYTPTRSYINILGGIDNWVAEEVEDNEGNVIGSRYGQVVNVNNAVITPNSKVDMQISSEQMVIFHEKDLAFVAENEGGVVTIYCIGNVPENDYTMQVTVTEVGTNA